MFLINGIRWDSVVRIFPLEDMFASGKCKFTFPKREFCWNFCRKLMTGVFK
jgi:hypothetical protein